MDKFTTAYIEAALWSSTDNSDDSGCRPLDDNYSIEDIAHETLASILEDCKAFQEDHAQDIGGNVEQAGHDFWLTRNHHGAGFWDEIGKLKLEQDLRTQAMLSEASIYTLVMMA